MRLEYSIRQLKQVGPKTAEEISQLMKQRLSAPIRLSTADLKKIVSSPLTYIFVALNKEDKIIGMITIVSYLTLQNTYKTWVEDFFVDETVRRQGVGEKLMKQSLIFAKKLNIKVINLTSRPSRIAANLLYQELGFKIYHTNYYRYKL